MTTDDLPRITRLYRACEPRQALRPNDSRWVDFDAVRGDENVVALYARSLRRSAPRHWDFKLFTGHRGVGKTSRVRIHERRHLVRGQPGAAVP